MGSYKPTAEDFADNASGTQYKPSSQDFQEEQNPDELRDENIRKMTGFKGLAAETLLNLSNAMKSGVLFAYDLPKMYKQANEAAAKERPFRPWLATAGGLADIAKATINAPNDLNKFLSRKLDFIPNAQGLIPHLPDDTGLAELTGLSEEQPEDRLYKGLATALSFGAPSAAKVFKGIEGGKAPAKVLPKHLEDKINKEKKLLQIGQDRLAKFKESLESHPEYRSGNPSTLLRTAADYKIKASEKEPYTKIPFKEIPEIPEAPNVSAMNRAAKEEKIQASEALSKGLGEGKLFHMEGGESLLKETEDIRKNASNQFKETKDYFSEHNIEIDKTEKINEIKDKINGLKEHYKHIPGYETGTPDVVALEKQLTKLQQPEFVKASDVLDIYQTLYKLAKDAHDKIYERGSSLSQIEKTSLTKLSTEYENLADGLGNILENVGDKNGIKMLQKAKSSWKEYASLYGNPIFQYLEKHKALHPSTFSNLNLGTRGNELLNKIVENNPELRQAIFGQKFANPSSHKAFLRPNEAIDKHLSKLPEINDLVEAYRNANETEKEVKSTSNELKEEHQTLAKSLEEEAKRQEERKNAFEDIEKYTKLSDKKTKAANLVKKKMKDSKARGENISALEKQLEELELKNSKYKKLLQKAIKIAYRYGGIKSAIGH